MNRRREPCRNFQRGSCQLPLPLPSAGGQGALFPLLGLVDKVSLFSSCCQYGDRCKFLHVTQQQSKLNPFGFGSQSASQLSQNSQQSKPNPFGFGVQNPSQLKGPTNFDVRNQYPSKPFENKWIRPAATAKSTSSQQEDTQKQAAVHECTDPESCKRQIVEDFKNEAPLWKLTCYGHWKYLPCDIVGDVSFEELRAAAYEDAKRGLTLQSIVERERNLLNSKVSEFDNLLRNPFELRRYGPNSANQFPVSSNSVTVNSQNNRPPTFSSFSQLGASASFVPNVSFEKPLPGIPSNSAFGQPSFPQSTGQISGGLEMKFGASGQFDGQLPMQQFGSSPGPSTSSITNGFMAMGSERSPLHSSSPQFPSSGNNLFPGFLHGVDLGQSRVNQAAAADKEDVGADDTIWSKEWDIGEIPEEAPPERVCF